MNSFFASRQLWTCPHSFQTYMSGRVKQPLFKSVFYLMIVTYLKPYAFWIKISFKLQAAFLETNELLCHLWSCPHTTAFGFFFFLLRQRQCLPWRLLLQRCLHSCFHKSPLWPCPSLTSKSTDVSGSFIGEISHCFRLLSLWQISDQTIHMSHLE